MSENTQIDVKTIDYKYVDIVINNNTTDLMPASYMKILKNQFYIINKIINVV